MFCVSCNSEHVICLKITREEYSGLTCCHGNNIIVSNIPSTVLYRPCFDIILMKFEANWVKIRCWIQSIFKMTHFLLSVGSAITLAPNSYIYVIGIIQWTNSWSLIKIRKCMWMLLDISCFSFFALISTPRHSQTFEISKIPWQFCIPNVLRSCSLSFEANS